MTGKSIKFTVWCLVLAIAAGFSASSALALGDEPRPGGETVTQYLTPAILEAIFPGADKVGEVGGDSSRCTHLQG